MLQMLSIAACPSEKQKAPKRQDFKKKMLSRTKFVFQNYGIVHTSHALNVSLPSHQQNLSLAKH